VGAFAGYDEEAVESDGAVGARGTGTLRGSRPGRRAPAMPMSGEEREVVEAWWRGRGVTSTHGMRALVYYSQTHTELRTEEALEATWADCEARLPGVDLRRLFNRQPSLLWETRLFEESFAVLREVMGQNAGDAGCLDSDLVHIVNRAPALLATKEDTLRSKLGNLATLLEGQNLHKVVRYAPTLLGLSEERLQRNFALLKRLFPRCDIAVMVGRAPPLLYYDIEGYITMRFQQLEALFPEAEVDKLVEGKPMLLYQNVPVNIGNKAACLQEWLTRDEWSALQTSRLGALGSMLTMSPVRLQRIEFLRTVHPGIPGRISSFLSLSDAAFQVRFPEYPAWAPDPDGAFSLAIKGELVEVPSTPGASRTRVARRAVGLDDGPPEAAAKAAAASAAAGGGGGAPKKKLGRPPHRESPGG